jgi:hypothetical protein
MIYELEGLVPNQTNINGVTFTGSLGVTISPSNITEDTLIEVTIATDPNPIFNFRGEESEYILKMEDEPFILRSEEGEVYLPFIEMTWTDTFGESFTESILINL